MHNRIKPKNIVLNYVVCKAHNPDYLIIWKPTQNGYDLWTVIIKTLIDTLRERSSPYLLIYEGKSESKLPYFIATK